MAISPATFLYKNGIVLPAADTPPITTLLATRSGAYTTTRTHNNGDILLFYERHLSRLSNSLQILLNSNPNFIFGRNFSGSLYVPPVNELKSLIRRRVHVSLRNALPVALEARREGEELAISALVGGNVREFMGRVDEEVAEMVLDVYVHIGMYVPPVFGVEGNGARLAVVMMRRDFAQAKYSDWARLRKPLEALKPASATELLLSNDDGRILEGTLTNFFVVSYKGSNDASGRGSPEGSSWYSYEVQTAPVNDGVLPGIIRQLVIEICMNMGITVREVSPSWLERGSWREAFITSKSSKFCFPLLTDSDIGLYKPAPNEFGNKTWLLLLERDSLRLIQHVELIQAPSSWASTESNTWEDVLWVEKHFTAGPGMITAAIQKEIMKKAGLEGCSVAL